MFDDKLATEQQGSQIVTHSGQEWLITFPTGYLTGLSDDENCWNTDISLQGFDLKKILDRNIIDIQTWTINQNNLFTLWVLRINVDEFNKYDFQSNIW